VATLLEYLSYCGMGAKQVIEGESFLSNRLGKRVASPSISSHSSSESGSQGRGGVRPIAISIAYAEQCEWTPPQTPQAREVMKIASRGSRPIAITS
jgi:hypothetical protein